MLVFDIKPDEFEYAFSFDGPYEPAKGLLFNEENVAQTHIQERSLDSENGEKSRREARILSTEPEL